MNAIWQNRREALVRAGRAANSALDVLFYDVGALSTEEYAALSARGNPEGSVLVVHPLAAEQAIEKYTPLHFIRAQQQGEAVKVDAVVVAGVGSSALGTAALARNVADHLGRPVAGIVSGFGLADMVTEALGGWFVLGFKNSIRDSFAKTFDYLEMKDHVWDDASYSTLVRDEDITGFNMDRYVYGSPDSAALLLVLYHLREQMQVLVGHSKGNYSIENALEGLVSLCAVKNEAIPDHLRIVTLGATIRFPAQFPNVEQFMGSIDLFGMINSRPKLEVAHIPWAWHSLNGHLPGHLPVEKVLELAGVE